MSSDRLHFREIARTSAFRLTVLLGGVFAAGLVLLLGAVYLMTARELTARTDQILHVEASRLIAAPPARLPSVVAEEVARSNGFTFIALIAQDGEQIVGDITLDRPVPAGRPVERWTVRGAMRLIAARTRTGETIIVARDISQIRYVRQRILLILLMTGILALGGVGAAATFLALGPLRRVRDLQQAAREIAAGRLGTRMPIAGRHDELDQIAATTNQMVEELGRVVAQVKGVTDAVAHDLRTPLSRVRGRLVRIARSGEAAVEAEDAIADLDVVLARFAALLRIAEIEAGARRAYFRSVDLAGVIEEVLALYEPLAQDAGVALSSDGVAAMVIEGDRELLIEAVSNLVDNAIKFARSTVHLSIEPRSGGIALIVRDDGGGIPVAERDAVLRRFHRGTNAADRPGAGLGLSIVAAIAHLHGLELRLMDAEPGLAAALIAEPT